MKKLLVILAVLCASAVSAEPLRTYTLQEGGWTKAEAKPEVACINGHAYVYHAKRAAPLFNGEGKPMTCQEFKEKYPQ